MCPFVRLCNTRPIGPDNPYQIVAGGAWAQAATGVRLGLTPPLEASGLLRIEVAHRGIAGLIARMIMLPPEGEAVEAKLSLSREGQCVRWVRRFGNMGAESVQTFARNAYIERAGPFRLGFRIESDGSALYHVQTSTRLFGVLVPKFFGPEVAGLMAAGPDDRSWQLEVEISHCWFGRICRYEGLMHVQ